MGARGVNLKPFFSYFGGKWRAAPRYPKPQHDMIVEPFAGGAGYALRYPDRDVVLIDRDPVVVGVWQYLIDTPSDEITALPELKFGQSVDDLDVPRAAKDLIGFWCNAASVQPKKTLSAWARSHPHKMFWCNPAVKKRIIEQQPFIRHWRVFNLAYEDVPDVEATWFIDPPYVDAGQSYVHNTIDYSHLGEWCRSRSGQVIVCENHGATWLPFEHFAKTKATHGKDRSGVSHEVVWCNA